MATTIGNEALKANPALKALAALIGEWETVGSHPYLPGKALHGRAKFEWIEKGAFLLWRSEISEPEIPSGVAIFGSDDTTDEIFMLYFDERNVSRKYDISVKQNVISLQRTSADFSQRMVLTVANDGKTIVSKVEMSKEGGSWEPDLELSYSRID